MSALYGHLICLFLEVSPLLPALPKKKGRRRLAPGLFDYPAELAYVQTLPGLYELQRASLSIERPCFVVLDAPQPLLLPGTLADFRDAQFLYPAYQVPLYAGSAQQVNVDPAEVARLARADLMDVAKVLDDNLQGLIQAAAYAPSPASLGRILMEKLRVWSVEDYLKPSFLRNVKALVTDVSDTLYQSALPPDSTRKVQERILAIKKSLKALSVRMDHKPDAKETYVHFLLRAMPHLEAMPTIQATLLGVMEAHTLMDTPDELDIGWMERLSFRRISLLPPKINSFYWAFVREQVQRFMQS